jgi:hypothetical protein
MRSHHNSTNNRIERDAKVSHNGYPPSMFDELEHDNKKLKGFKFVAPLLH